MSDKKPKLPEKEIDILTRQSDEFSAQVKDLSTQPINQAPAAEVEPQTKLSSKEIDRAKRIELKPKNKISDGQKFNEKFRDQWNFDKEYVQFIAEHKELIGETIEIWTHPYGGVGAEYWEVPTNKPVWGPRYLAEQIRRKCYNRLVMEERATPDNYVGSNGIGAMYGKIVVQNKIQRLSADPVFNKKSIFMGEAVGF